jgi:cytochrome b subunit of formate dehydrogenase
VAQETCAPCHESAVLNEKYGLRAGRLTSFIDSYHGLKSRAGDTHVANCASCHGVHRILPSTDPTSTIYPDNLQVTCGECHPGISPEMAAQPIHGVAGQGLQTSAADIVEKVYIVVIVVIIGLMVLHWLIDLIRQLKNLFGRRPQVRRMDPNEVWQHAFLMVTFVVLVISGFALRFGESGLTQLFFGWEGGFGLRGIVHRFSAVFFILTVIWHSLFLTLSGRGRRFLGDMWPARLDFAQFVQRIQYNLGRRPEGPRFGRFSYVEKAEYWALIWGSAIMIVTGLPLWFDNWVVQFLPKGVLDVALVIHYYEAWLATLAILVWHMYSTVFSPQVYPMNPSWLTGMMPEKMYRHEHPEHFEQVKKDTEEHIRREMERLSAPSTPDESEPSD